ncbi:MAG: hypothetical protein MJZ67_02940 [Bacteroidales bacterium]|nr:hypothetical protein [Bacteroidales bacterium]
MQYVDSPSIQLQYIFNHLQKKSYLCTMNRPSSTCCPISLNATFSSTFVGMHFTGKERDEETGYGYFGARCMDHELMTIWLSVDPKADKYPGISPYTYCAWNPVKLVDPDGCEFGDYYDQWFGRK